MDRMSLELPDNLGQAMRHLAASHDRPLAREIRRALDQYVQRELEDPGIGETLRTIYIDPAEDPVPREGVSNG
jgi:predicted transcriptional regulator